jgi:hypothetical protein
MYKQTSPPKSHSGKSPWKVTLESRPERLEEEKEKEKFYTVT